MDGIVALCHFCEQHGPAVLMCTQLHRQNPPPGIQQPGCPQDVQQQQQAAVRKISVGLASTVNSSVVSSVGGSTGGTGADVAGVGAGRYYDAVGGLTSSQDQQQTNNCRACSIVTREEVGFTSHDFTAKIEYISTQFPSDFSLVPVLRSACLRSLSSEDLPGREGPVYFGDDTNGHVISYAFLVKDSRARGSQVKFSFLLITWDQIFLMNLWPFVVKNFESMASRLQRASNHVYEEETMGESGGSGGGGRSVTPPARAARAFGTCAATTSSRPIGAASPGLGLPTTSPGGGGGYQNAPLLTSQAIAAGNAVASAYSTNSLGRNKKGRNRRATDSDMRSLADLTKDDQVLYRIHAWFTWLLRLAGRYWTFCAPLSRGPPNEDALVELEEREGLQESASASLSHLSIGQEAMAHNPGSRSNLQDPSSLLIGQQLGWSDGSPEAEASLHMRLLMRLYRCLGEEMFSSVLLHVVTGRQVIVLPLEDSRLGSLTVVALSRLLPRGCIQMIIDNSEYVPAYMCNLLSTGPEVSISCPPAADPYLLLQVSMYSPSPVLAVSHSGLNMALFSSTNGGMEDNDSVQSEAELLLNSLHFVPTFSRAVQTQSSGGVRRQQSHPVAIDRTMTAQERRDSFGRSTSPAAWASSVRASSPLPSSPNTTSSSTAAKAPFSSSLVRQMLALFQLDPALNASTFALALDAIRQEWIDKSRLLYAFKRCQGPTLGVDEACKRALGLINASGTISPEDELVIRFWQKALSQQTQQSVCHSIPSSSSTQHHHSSIAATVATSATVNPSSSLSFSSAPSAMVSVAMPTESRRSSRGVVQAVGSPASSLAVSLPTQQPDFGQQRFC